MAASSIPMIGLAPEKGSGWRRRHRWQRPMVVLTKVTASLLKRIVALKGPRRQPSHRSA